MGECFGGSSGVSIGVFFLVDEDCRGLLFVGVYDVDDGDVVIEMDLFFLWWVDVLDEVSEILVDIV